MEHERADVAPDVEHQGFRGSLERARVNVRFLWAFMDVAMKVSMLMAMTALMLLQGHGVPLGD
jgi:hypothetical protein